MVKKYSDAQKRVVHELRIDSAQRRATMHDNTDDFEETTFFEIEKPPNSTSAMDADWDLPMDSDPTPLYVPSKDEDVAMTYFLALQQSQSRKPLHYSSEIDTRANRLVLELIHAPFIEQARTQLHFLRRNTASEIAIHLIDQVIEKGLHYEDIDASLTEPEYRQLKSRCIRQAIIRLWQKTRSDPELVHIAQIQAALKRGDVTFDELSTVKAKFDLVAKKAHEKFAEHIIRLIRINHTSLDLIALLKTCIEIFHIDPEPLGMPQSEYSTLLELYKLAS